jgi:hypothetical protein
MARRMNARLFGQDFARVPSSCLRMPCIGDPTTGSMEPMAATMAR